MVGGGTETTNFIKHEFHKKRLRPTKRGQQFLAESKAAHLHSVGATNVVSPTSPRDGEKQEGSDTEIAPTTPSEATDQQQIQQQPDQSAYNHNGMGGGNAAGVVVTPDSITSKDNASINIHTNNSNNFNYVQHYTNQFRKNRQQYSHNNSNGGQSPSAVKNNDNNKIDPSASSPRGSEGTVSTASETTSRDLHTNNTSLLSEIDEDDANENDIVIDFDKYDTSDNRQQQHNNNSVPVPHTHAQSQQQQQQRQLHPWQKHLLQKQKQHNSNTQSNNNSGTTTNNNNWSSSQSSPAAIRSTSRTSHLQTPTLRTPTITTTPTNHPKPATTEAATQSSAMSVTSNSIVSTESLSTNDKLMIMRDGAEKTIIKLRNELTDMTTRRNKIQSSLNKSEAVILELKSTIKSLNEEIQKLKDSNKALEKTSKEQIKQFERELNDIEQHHIKHIQSLQKQIKKQEQEPQQSSSTNQQPQQQEKNQKRSTMPPPPHHQNQINQKQDPNGSSSRVGNNNDTSFQSYTSDQHTITSHHSRDDVIGELQVQLDRAHAQILTADMVRKELEDTLEAEQYTWELRVQDQERIIANLTSDISTSKNDYIQLRNQWKEAEVGWLSDIDTLRKQLDVTKKELYDVRNNNNSNDKQPHDVDDDENDSANSNNSTSNKSGAGKRSIKLESASSDVLKERIKKIDAEKKELQSCLDEAMAELEAVDKEVHKNVLLYKKELERMKEENVKLQKIIDDDDTYGPLKDLAIWLHDENFSSSTSLPAQKVISNNPEVLVKQIKSYVENLHNRLHASREQQQQGQNPNNESRDITFDSSGDNNETDNNSNNDENLQRLRTKVDELENQILVYKSDLKTKDETTVELRTSLQEAVSLLKPLQDVVDKTEQEKSKLQTEIENLKQALTKSEKERDLAINGSVENQSNTLSTVAQELQTTRRELSQKDDEINTLQNKISLLEKQLNDEKTKEAFVNGITSIAANGNFSTPGSPQRHQQTSAQPTIEHSNKKLEKARQELLLKRESEKKLQLLLSDAQNKFTQINEQNRQMENENLLLQEKLAAERQSPKSTSTSTWATPPPSQQLNFSSDTDNTGRAGVTISAIVAEHTVELEQRDNTIKQLEQEVNGYREELKIMRHDLVKSKEELRERDERLQHESESDGESKLSQGRYMKMESELKTMKEERHKEQVEQAKRINQLEREIKRSRKELAYKKDEQHTLNNSLKEALHMLQPLQQYLEEAEDEKARLKRELIKCKKRLQQQQQQSPSRRERSFTSNNDVDQAREEMERIVEELEEENSRLNSTLEDLSVNLSTSADDILAMDSQSFTNSSSKDDNNRDSKSMKETFVELKSRYEVTKKLLDNSNDQKAKLNKTLEEKEKAENELIEEINILKEKLMKSDEELENAKYIATSALVKVEEMTMAMVEKEISNSKGKNHKNNLSANSIDMSTISRSILSGAGTTQSGDYTSEDTRTQDVDKDEELETLRKKVQLLEQDVKNQRELNTSLEDTINERDTVIQKFIGGKMHTARHQNRYYNVNHHQHHHEQRQQQQRRREQQKQRQETKQNNQVYYWDDSVDTSEDEMRLM